MTIFNSKKKIFISLLLTVFIFIIIGASNSDTYRSIAKSQRILNEVYKHLIVNYADELNMETFTKTSINKMLSDLDPYTVYLESEERDGLDLLTRGKYGGVGIQLGKRDDLLTVISPMDDSPAQRAGILSGDVIIKIDEKKTKDLNLNEAAKLIRGRKGTNVVLTIKRLGEDESIDFHLTRADIKVHDVPYAEMIDENTGYIVLSRFSKNASQEMESALRSLMDQNMENLILDLRNNPGGLLSSAIEILELIVPKGEKLLTTKGRNKDSNREFISKKNPILDENIKIAVLINEGSASASEIVSGVIQDLDRGIIIGKRSFGKGLVQSIFGIDKKRSLKVTTAKYYIPSGRLIQKPNYLNEDVIVSKADKDTVFTTKAGRSVKGGGGIYPDFVIDDTKVGPLTRECWRKSYFFSFARDNKNKYSTMDDVLNDTNMMILFSDYLSEKDLDVKIDGQTQFEESVEKLKKYDENNAKLNDAFKSIKEFIQDQTESLFEAEYSDLENGVYSNFAQIYGGNKGRIHFNIQHDDFIEKANEMLHNPIAYTETFQSISDN
ncbi:MAG: S41 family peptidase [Candidatus Marinimicrobia bacterium]|nr:S41 family peptidase [Candidatus Neomarinimicrobiota bacterium]